MSRHPFDNVQRQPHTCVWEITRACNLRCMHCENFGGVRSDEELPFEKMLQVVDSLARLGCKRVDLTGGEPLLHPKWDQLASALAQNGMRTAIITNGTLFDEDALDRAIQARVERVAFSVDGLKSVHDTIRRRPGVSVSIGRPTPFDETIRNLRWATLRIKTFVITPVMLLNLHQLGEMRQLLRDCGVETWQIQLAVPTGRALENKSSLILAPEHLDELTRFIALAQADGELPRIDTSDTIGYYTERERLMRKRSTGQGVWLGCQGGIRVVAIDFEGKVKGCSMLPPEFDAGDLRNESLEDIWRDSKRFGYSTAFDPRKLEGDCKPCRFGPLCRAGCTAMAYYSTGVIYTNPYCIGRPGIMGDRLPSSGPFAKASSS